ncbi:MAG: hypothetical protein ABIP95_15060 [Pelobium sp.]
MKNKLILIPAMLLGISCAMVACNKADEITLSEDQLTTCDSNATCENIFTLSSDVDRNYNYVAEGNYKVFTARKTYTGSQSQTNLFIMAPKNGDSFSLSGNDIKNGRVKLQLICTACNYANFKLIGGEVKGKNLLPEKALDQSKWLIEAKIIMATDLQVKGDQKLKDTIYIKQYFYPNFVFD